jgi:hypothetical protein
MAAEGQNDGDLRATLAISQAEAQYGTTRTITLPGGRSVAVSIPADTRTGKEIRLEGQGQPRANGGPPGALILTIAVAPAENFGYSPYPIAEANMPTEFISPPPPPPPSSVGQPFYSGVGQASSHTSYPAQGQLYLNPSPPTPAPPLPAYPPYTQLPQPSQQPRRRSAGLVGLLIILVLLVIVGSLLTFYVGVYQPAQLRIQATSTAVAQVTGTAQAQTSATAQVLATQQAQVNATATAQTLAADAATATVTTLQASYTQITSGPPTLNDPLSAPSNAGWASGPECGYANNAYHAKETQNNILLYCSANNTNFSNFVYRVHMTILSGQLGGIIFRADSVNSKFYLFRVAQDGSYDLYLYADKTGKNAKRLTAGNATSMHTGLQVENTLAVVARGSQIDLYINDQYQTSVSDTTFQYGQIGVVAENDGSLSEVAYTQAQVWRI